jgi:hypothetical protein
MIKTLGLKFIAPVVLTGAAAAIISAPAAGATDSPDCSDRGTSAVCTRTGHASIYAEPRNDLHTFSIAPGQSPLLAID